MAAVRALGVYRPTDDSAGTQRALLARLTDAAVLNAEGMRPSALISLGPAPSVCNCLEACAATDMSGEMAVLATVCRPGRGLVTAGLVSAGLVSDCSAH